MMIHPPADIFIRQIYKSLNLLVVGSHVVGVGQAGLAELRVA